MQAEAKHATAKSHKPHPIRLGSRAFHFLELISEEFHGPILIPKGFPVAIGLHNLLNFS